MDERQLDIFKSKRQKGVKPKPALERATHIAIADLLRVGLKRDWWASHIPSGELRSDATGKLLKRMGTKPGMTDFMLLGPPGVHFLELKRPPNRISAAQQDFFTAAAIAGAQHSVAWSYEEAVEILRNWGAIRLAFRG